MQALEVVQLKSLVGFGPDVLSAGCCSAVLASSPSGFMHSSELVFESPVQSGLWPIFGKIETETSL